MHIGQFRSRRGSTKHIDQVRSRRGSTKHNGQVRSRRASTMHIEQGQVIQTFKFHLLTKPSKCKVFAWLNLRFSLLIFPSKNGPLNGLQRASIAKYVYCTARK